MHIGIDARELLGYTTGIGRYLGNLCYKWAESARGKSRGTSRQKSVLAISMQK